MSDKFWNEPRAARREKSCYTTLQEATTNLFDHVVVRGGRNAERICVDKFSDSPFQIKGQMFECPSCNSTFRCKDDFEVHKLTYHYKAANGAEDLPFGRFNFAIEPVDTVRIVSDDRLGRFRGLQGENNSCYLDSCMVGMFYPADTFDGLLLAPHEGAERRHDIEYARHYMTLHIVNGMRKRGFVPSSIIFEWRRMISHWFGNVMEFETHCQEEEACEFLAFLVKTFNGAASLGFSTQQRLASRGEKRRTLSKQQQCTPQLQVMLQLLPPTTDAQRERVWTTQQLLEYTLKTENLAFTKLGRSLVLQTPRYGKKERVMGNVVPSPSIFAMSHGSSPQKCRYELQAVVVIGRSHFVTYLRVSLPPENSNSRSHPVWLYFDSMSDRVDEQNVPLLENVSDQLCFLECSNAAMLLSQELRQPNRNHLHRVVEDLSVAIYRRVDSHNLTTI